MSFCLVSKHVHRLSAANLARHRVMIQQYHKVVNHSLSDHTHYCYRVDRLPELLCRVLDDPLVGRYVNWIDFDLWFSRFRVDRISVDSVAHKEYPGQQTDTFESAMRSVNLPIQYQDVWLEALAKCDGDALVTLLLLHTPNLERLDIRQLRHSCWHKRESFPASIAIVAHLASKATFMKPCLQHLRHVSLDLGSSINSLLLAMPFMSLPSVTSLASRFGDCEAMEYPIECVTLPRASSNVVDMRLVGHSTDCAELSEVLEGCKNLAYLYVKLTDYSMYEDHLLSCPDVVAILLRSSGKHSLKSLRLRTSLSEVDRPEDERNPIDCTRFENLRQIDVEAELLLKPEDQYNPKAIVDRLPQSLQRLYLKYGEEHNLDYERDSLRALENPKMAQLTNLISLQVQVDDTMRAECIAESLSGGEETFGLDYTVCGLGFEKTFKAVSSGDKEYT